MNEVSKISLSAEERSTLGNHRFFESKKLITDKIYHQFSDIIHASKQQDLFRNIAFPAGTDYSTGKITKGENYLGLPYLLLDFPRNFQPDYLLAVRTMIWWGKFFSCTLLAGGKELPHIKSRVLQQKTLLGTHHFSICIHSSPWHHHFQKDNYLPIATQAKKEIADIMRLQNFVKIARKKPIASINTLEPFVLESFSVFALLLRK